MSESKPKDDKMFFSSYLSKIMTPSGKTRAFETYDAYSFNEITDINDGKSIALKKNHKLKNYEDGFCDNSKKMRT